MDPQALLGSRLDHRCSAPPSSQALLMESAGLSSDCTQRRVTYNPVQRRRCAILRRMRCFWTLPAPALPQSSWASAPMLSPTSTRRRARRACASSSATSVPHSSAACWVVTHAGYSARSAPPGPQEPTKWEGLAPMVRAYLAASTKTRTAGPALVVCGSQPLQHWAMA